MHNDEHKEAHKYRGDKYAFWQRMKGCWESATFVNLIDILHDFVGVVTQICNKECFIIAGPHKNAEFCQFYGRVVSEGNRSW